MREPPSPPGRKFAHAARLASYQRLQSSNGSAPGLVPSDKLQLSFRTSRTNPSSPVSRIKRLAGSPTRRPKRRELAALVSLRRLPTPPDSRDPLGNPTPGEGIVPLEIRHRFEDRMA